MLWLNKSKKKKMWHCGKVRKCENNRLKRNQRYRQSIPAHEYRRNKVFAVGHQASVYGFSDGLPVAD